MKSLKRTRKKKYDKKVMELKWLLSQLRKEDKSPADKQKIWKKFISRMADSSGDVCILPSFLFRSLISRVPNKQQSWEDLLIVVSRAKEFPLEDPSFVFDTNFQYVPDKQNAWNSLYKLTRDKKASVRIIAAYS